jgi:hypothetical protein
MVNKMRFYHPEEQKNALGEQLCIANDEIAPILDLALTR